MLDDSDLARQVNSMYITEKEGISSHSYSVPLLIFPTSAQVKNFQYT